MPKTKCLKNGEGKMATIFDKLVSDCEDPPSSEEVPRCERIIIDTQTKGGDKRLQEMSCDPFFRERWEWSRGETTTQEPANDSEGDHIDAIWHECWEEARTMSDRTFRFSRSPHEEDFTSFRVEFGEFGSSSLFYEFLRSVMEKYGFSEYDPAVTLYWVGED